MTGPRRHFQLATSGLGAYARTLVRGARPRISAAATRQITFAAGATPGAAIREAIFGSEPREPRPRPAVHGGPSRGGQPRTAPASRPTGGSRSTQLVARDGDRPA